MTIPTEAAFVTSIEKLSRCNAAFLLPAFSKQLFATENSDDALRLICMALQSREDCADEIHRDEVVEWIDNQDAYPRVMSKLVPRTAGDIPVESLEDQARRHLDRFRKIATFANDARRKWRTDQAIYSLLGVSSRSLTNWYLGLVKAIREYHYSDSVEKIIEDRRRLNERIDIAIAGISALKEIASDTFVGLQFHSMQYVPLDRRHSSGAENRYLEPDGDDLDRRIEILMAIKGIDRDKLYPLSRHDSTAKERLFIFRMAQRNFRCFKSNKPEAIAGLLEMEGFKNQIDLRTIERQCSATTRRQRHLYEEYLKFTAGAGNGVISDI